MSDKQAAYSERRQALTRPQLEGWVRDMIALGEPAAPAVFNCQQDAPEAAGECFYTAAECEAECPCGGITFDPAGSIHDPGPLRDAWMAGRDAAAYAALRAAVDGACGLAIASRAALVMPQSDEVEL